MADPPKDHDPEESELKHALDELAGVLARIPYAKQLQNDLGELRALLVDRRPPRIAAIGRRGAGKSSLANALMGAEVLQVGAVADTTKTARWLELTHNKRVLRWMDTPGLRAGEAPERRDTVREALAAEPPDVVLFASKATQVDAGIDEDLAEVLWLLDRQKSVGLTPPGLVAVVTKVDELAPLSVKSPPYTGDKKKNIDRAVEVLGAHLARVHLTPSAVVPVGTYMRFFSDQSLAVDWRWNLNALGDALLKALPHGTHFEAARALEGARILRRRVGRRIVNAATSIAFAVGALPIPVADLAILAPLQSVMVTSLALLSGRTIDKRGVSEWLASLGVNAGAGFALREAARALIKLVGSGLATSISGAMAAGGTWALGMSAMSYFLDNRSLEESRKVFEEARRGGAPKDIETGARPADPDDADPSTKTEPADGPRPAGQGEPPREG